MSFSADAILVLIASPSDTADERAAVYEALGQWNVSRGEREAIVVIAWLYEQHAVPLLGDGPQSVINHQAFDDRVQVTWNEQGSDDEKTWKYPLPAGPPRR